MRPRGRRQGRARACRTCVSRSRKASSPSSRKMSGMVQPAEASISASVSRKGYLSAPPTSLPTVLFPLRRAPAEAVSARARALRGGQRLSAGQAAAPAHHAHQVHAGPLQPAPHLCCQDLCARAPGVGGCARAAPAAGGERRCAGTPQAPAAPQQPGRGTSMRRPSSPSWSGCASCSAPSPLWRSAWLVAMVAASACAQHHRRGSACRQCTARHAGAAARRWHTRRHTDGRNAAGAQDLRRAGSGESGCATQTLERARHLNDHDLVTHLQGCRQALPGPVLLAHAMAAIKAEAQLRREHKLAVIETV
jgi:hypothetical protein